MAQDDWGEGRALEIYPENINAVDGKLRAEDRSKRRAKRNEEQREG